MLKNNQKLSFFVLFFVLIFSNFTYAFYTFDSPQYVGNLPVGSSSITPLSDKESEYVVNTIIRSCKKNCNLKDINDLKNNGVFDNDSLDTGLLAFVYKGNFDNQTSNEYMIMFYVNNDFMHVYFFKILNNKVEEINFPINSEFYESGNIPTDSPAFTIKGKTYLLNNIGFCTAGIAHCEQPCSIIWDGKKNTVKIVPKYSSTPACFKLLAENKLT